MNDTVRHTVCPLLAALIWGFAFSAQSVCADFLGPFSVNAGRGLIAFVILLAACLLRRRRSGKKGLSRELLLGSLCCGTALFIASNFQQFGLADTDAGKAGFITALYIVLVPIAGIFMGKKLSAKVWLAVLIAVVGMYFLCISDDFSLAFSDLMVLICALMFTVQIVSVDLFVQKVDSVELSCGMFFFEALFSGIGVLLFESPTLAGVQGCIWQLLYVAVFSSCIAYTLQIVAQKGANTAVVSLLLSLESVFALIGGAVFLHEKLSGRELLGCAIMLAAIVLAEWPERDRARTA